MSALLANIESPEFNELHLSGELSTADIIRAAEDQFGIRVVLPETADNRDRSNYNHIISLKQLVDAIKVKYSRRQIPLSHRFVEGELIFSKIVPKTQVKPKKTNTSPIKATTAPISQPKYPVPVISQHFPDNDMNPVATSKKSSVQPVLPNWVQTKKPKTRQNIINRNYPSTGSGFEVQIPPQKKTKVSVVPLSAPGTSAAIPPRSTQSPVLLKPMPLRGSSSSRSSGSYPKVTSPYPTSSPQAFSDSTRSFGITPYPEDAVGFFNDAPSIVPSASRENFIEWSTRIEGALEQGNHAVLDKEEKELLRRLRWLQNNKP